MKIDFFQENIWKFRRWSRRFDKRRLELDQDWARRKTLKFSCLPCNQILAAWVEDNSIRIQVDYGIYTIPEEGFSEDGYLLAKALITERPKFWW